MVGPLNILYSFLPPVLFNLSLNQSLKPLPFPFKRDNTALFCQFRPEPPSTELHLSSIVGKSSFSLASENYLRAPSLGSHSLAALYESSSYYPNERVEPRHFIKERGLFRSQFWRLNVQTNAVGPTVLASGKAS